MQKIIHFFGYVLLICIGLRADATITSTPTRDKLASVYISQIGVTEATGRNDGVVVESYQRVTGNRKGDAWCASFVAWCLKQAGLNVNGNGAARSWFTEKYVVYTRSTHGVRNFHKLALKRGNTGSLYYKNIGRIGHIFFIDNIHGDYIITVEGNTNAGMSREGGGVFRLRRHIRNVYSVSDHVRR